MFAIGHATFCDFQTCLRDVACRGRTATLVGNDFQLISLRRKLQDRFDKILAAMAINP